MKNNKSASGYNYKVCFLFLIKIKSIARLRRIRHFEILGNYLGNLIVSQKDLAT
jgi:hypothetical protein